jgi:hypothetical protein
METSLIEPEIKYFLYNKLKSCHEYKVNIYSWIINTIIFVVLASFFCAILYFSRKQKLTPYEQSEKLRKEQEYVLSKIRDYKEIHKSSSMITNLPTA